MIEINLLPEELRKKEATKISLPDMPSRKTLFKVFSIVVGVELFLAALAMFQGVETKWVAKEVAQLTATNKDTLAHKDEIVTMKSRIKDIRGLTQRKFHWASLLDALTHSMTKGVWLRSLSFVEVETKAKAPVVVKENAKADSGKKGKPQKAAPKKAAPEKAPAAPVKSRFFKLEGSVVAQGQETAYVGRFIKSIKENKFFSGLLDDVHLSGMTQKKIKDYDVYDFTLSCPIKREKM